MSFASLLFTAALAVVRTQTSAVQVQANASASGKHNRFPLMINTWISLYVRFRGSSVHPSAVAVDRLILNVHR